MLYTETNIYLVRHGETEWNQQERLQGNQNSPLTIIGKQQAYDVKKSLDQYEIHQAYVSPLKRARDTLDIILKDRKNNFRGASTKGCLSFLLILSESATSCALALIDVKRIAI